MIGQVLTAFHIFCISQSNGFTHAFTEYSESRAEHYVHTSGRDCYYEKAADNHRQNNYPNATN